METTQDFINGLALGAFSTAVLVLIFGIGYSIARDIYKQKP